MACAQTEPRAAAEKLATLWECVELPALSPRSSGLQDHSEGSVNHSIRMVVSSISCNGESVAGNVL